MLPRIERFVRTDRQETVRVGDGAVVMHVDTGVSYSLNAVGAWIWEQLAIPSDVDRLCEGLTERYEVSEERAGKDLEARLTDLQRTELVSRAP